MCTSFEIGKNNETLNIYINLYDCNEELHILYYTINFKNLYCWVFF